MQSAKWESSATDTREKRSVSLVKVVAKRQETRKETDTEKERSGFEVRYGEIHFSIKENHYVNRSIQQPSV